MNAQAKHLAAQKYRALLDGAGLRATGQRLGLCRLLFNERPRHLTVDMLASEAAAEGLRCSKSTVYRTLTQLAEHGLLRVLAVGTKPYFFDTDPSPHHHYYLEQEGEIINIPGHGIEVQGLPKLPKGRRISRIDVVVRLEE